MISLPSQTTNRTPSMSLSILFKEMKLIPLIDVTTSALLSHDMNFNDFLVEWDEMRKKHYNGEITDGEFEYWKLFYPKKSRFLRK